MKNRILSLSLLVFVTACQSQDTIQPLGEAAKIAEGLAIVQTSCASCHAIGVSGNSPREDAPPLRTVLASYNEGCG